MFAALLGPRRWTTIVSSWHGMRVWLPLLGVSSILAFDSPSGTSPELAPQGSPRQDEAEARVERRRVVVSLPDTGDARHDRLASALRGAVTRLGHAFALADTTLPSDETRDAAARQTLERWDADLALWIVHPTPEHYRIEVASRADRGVHARELSVSGQSLASAHEAVVNVVASIAAELPTVEAPDATVVDPPPEATPSTVPERPTLSEVRPPPPRRPRLWLGASYAGNTFADSVPWQSAIGIALSWSPVQRLAIGVGYDGMVPSRVERDGVELRLSRHSVRLALNVALWQGRTLDFGLLMGGALEPVIRSARSRAPSIAPTDSDLRMFSTATAGLYVAATPVPRVRLSLELAAEGLLTRARYVLETTSGAQVLVDPHPARFLLRFGIALGLH